MGAVCAPILGGNPLDEETLEKIKTLLADELKEFGEQYATLYKSKFIAAVKDIAKKKAAEGVKSTEATPGEVKLSPPRWYTVKQRPVKKDGHKKTSKKAAPIVSAKPIKSGTVQVALKNSSTYFPKHVTVNGNYTLSIRKDEADKDKKEISFLYYSAEKDTEKEKTIQVFYEEEQDSSDGEPKKEIVYRFQFTEDEELESWLEEFQKCTTDGPSHLDKDPVKSESFLEAYNTLRTKHGFSEDVKPLVGACELLGKAMLLIVNKEILNEKYAEIKAPVEQCTPAMQDVFRATVGRIIGSAVRAAFATASAVIDGVADKVRGGFETVVGKIYDVEQVVHDKIVSAVGSASKSIGSVIEKAANTIIKPALQPILDGLKSVISKINEFVTKALSLINEDLSMDAIRKWFSNVRKQIKECINDFQKGIEVLGTLIPIPEAVAAIQDFCTGLGDLIYAVFTSLEHIVLDVIFPAVADAVNSISSEIKIVIENGKIKVESFVQVIKKTYNDCIKALGNDCKHIVNDFFSVLLVPTAEKQWEDFVVEPVQKLGEELKSSIPESVQEFVNTEEVIGTTLDDVWRAAINPILKPTTDLINNSVDEVVAAAVAA